jgi:hypothetical protein
MSENIPKGKVVLKYKMKYLKEDKAIKNGYRCEDIIRVGNKASIETRKAVSGKVSGSTRELALQRVLTVIQGRLIAIFSRKLQCDVTHHSNRDDFVAR